MPGSKFNETSPCCTVIIFNTQSRAQKHAPTLRLAIMLLQKKMLPVNVVLPGCWEPATAFRRASPLCVSGESRLRGAHCKVLGIGSFGDVIFSFLARDNSLGGFRAQQHIHWKSLVHDDTF